MTYTNYGERYKLAIAMASVFLTMISCNLYVVLYRLEKLRIGDDFQCMDHAVITIKIIIALVVVSQFWLYNLGSFAFCFFLGGALLLYSIVRRSFAEVKEKTTLGMYAGVVSAMFFGSGACFAVIYYGIHKLNEDRYNHDPDLFLYRFLYYSIACVVSLLLALGFHQYQTMNKSQNEVELLPSANADKESFVMV